VWRRAGPPVVVVGTTCAFRPYFHLLVLFFSLRAPCRTFMPLVFVSWTVPCIHLVSASRPTSARTYIFCCRALSTPPAGCPRVANAAQAMRRRLGLRFQHNRAARALS
jgi:hypothetical protein